MLMFVDWWQISSHFTILTLLYVLLQIFDHPGHSVKLCQKKASGPQIRFDPDWSCMQRRSRVGGHTWAFQWCSAFHLINHFAIAPSPLSYVPTIGSLNRDQTTSFTDRLKNILHYSISMHVDHAITRPRYQNVIWEFKDPEADIYSLIQCANLRLHDAKRGLHRGISTQALQSFTW